MDAELWIPLAMVLIGLALLMAEMASPGYFLLIPATALIALGLFGLAFPGLFYSWISPVLVIVVLLPISYLTVKFYQRLSPEEAPQTTVATSLVGRTGVVIKAVEPNNISGRVKIGSDDWSATAEECLEVGANVIVDSSEGVHVHVRRTNGAAPACAKE